MTFGLYRGGQWVATPKRRQRFMLPPSLVTLAGECWRPNLRLSSDPSDAWTTDSLSLAMQRSFILRWLPSGCATSVRRIPS